MSRGPEVNVRKAAVLFRGPTWGLTDSLAAPRWRRRRKGENPYFCRGVVYKFPKPRIRDSCGRDW